MTFTKEGGMIISREIELNRKTIIVKKSDFKEIFLYNGRYNVFGIFFEGIKICG